MSIIPIGIWKMSAWVSMEKNPLSQCLDRLLVMRPSLWCGIPHVVFLLFYEASILAWCNFMTSVLSRKLASRRKRDDQSTIGQLRSDYTLRIIRWLLPQCCLLLQATLWHSKQLSIIFSPYSNCHTIRCILTYFRHRETLAFTESCKEMPLRIPNCKGNCWGVI